MPLNSYKCPECGKRNNYVVDLDEQGDQTVACSVCDTQITIRKDQLPERVLESLQELKAADDIFNDEQQVSILNDDDSIVDELLANMEEAFHDVKNSFNADSHEVQMDMNIAKIAETYAPIKGMADEKSKKLVQDMMGKSSGNWKRDAAVTIANKASEYVSDDQMMGRVLRYLSNSLEAGLNINDILDKQTMEASGLSKKERFILGQLAKSEQLNDIIARYLNGESF